jgi:hypothetical protein
MKRANFAYGAFNRDAQSTYRSRNSRISNLCFKPAKLVPRKADP